MSGHLGGCNVKDIPAPQKFSAMKVDTPVNPLLKVFFFGGGTIF